LIFILLKIKKVLMKRIFLFICIILFSGLELNGLSAQIDSKRKRNIYLDLGAFMGDTLNMFEVMGVERRAHKNTPWEIYAFEACPLLAHQTQLVVDKLNGLSLDEPVSFREVPRMHNHVLLAYEKNFPWSRRLGFYFEQFEKILVRRISTKGTYKNILESSIDKVREQMLIARAPIEDTRNRYMSFAAGVGPEDSFFEMKWHLSNYMNGGGNICGIDYGTPRHVFQIPVINLSNWIKNSFTKEDYIYVKMDIEGMEFSLVETLYLSGALDYIKEMDVEWHGRFDVPGREKEEFLKKVIRSKNIILRDHY
jgi:hypothetical protein